MARRRARRSTEEKLSPSAILFGIIFLGGIAAITLYVNVNRPAELDGYGCPIDESLIAENVILLFDTTEPFIASQVREISNRISSIVRAVPVMGRISAYEISSSENSATNVVPLNDQGAPYSCPIKGGFNVPDVMERFNERLISTISETVLDNVGQGAQPNSRIIDGLRFVAAGTIGQTYKSSIYVFSDMIEHSNVLSMYRSNWFESYQSNNAEIMSQRPIFPEGSEIQIFLVSRPKVGLDERKIMEFWTDVLSGDGFSSFVIPYFTRISGGS